MRSFNIIDVCWALRDAVRYSQAWDGRDCMQLQTFRFISSVNGAELTRDSMDAYMCDRYRPFFYSRYWEDNKYSENAVVGKLPALYLMQMAASREKATQRGTTRKQIAIGIVDKYDPDTDKLNCAGCPSRAIPQIYQDTEDMLAQVLKYLANVSYYCIDGEKYGLFHSDLMVEWANNGQVSSYTEEFTFSEKVHSLNLDINLEQVVFDSDRIYGTQAQLLVELQDCEIPDYCFNVTKYKFDR